MIKSDSIDKISNIFSHQDNDGEQFATKIVETRNKIYSYDSSIINNYLGEFNFNDDINFDSSGRYDIELNKILYQCLFCNGESNNSLYVSYNGARSEESIRNDQFYEKPGFPRWSYNGLYDGCFLGIDDPMYKLYKNLFIGWYYGDKQISYLDESIKIVKKICAYKNIQYKNVIFFSSSGGGYASILGASKLHNSLSISINPQLYIQNYTHAKNFTEVTSIDLNEYDEMHRNDLYYILKNSQSKHVIIVNVEDHHCFNQHLKVLLSKYNADVRYGLNIIDKNLLVWIYQAVGVPMAHISFETKYIYSAIDFIANQFKNNIDFDLDKNQKLAILVNEMWQDLYATRYDLYAAHKKIHQHQHQRHQDIFSLNNNAINFNFKDFSIVEENVRIEATKGNYNYHIFDIVEKLSYHLICIKKIRSSKSIRDITFSLFDFKNQEKIHSVKQELRSSDEYYYSFVTGENVDQVKFLVYAGVAGNTSGIDLNIEQVMLCKVPLRTFQLEVRQQYTPAE